MDYTKRFLSFLIDEIIFSVMSIVLRHYKIFCVNGKYGIQV